MSEFEPGPAQSDYQPHFFNKMVKMNNWWFGTKHFVSNDINRLSNVDDDSVECLVFRETILKSGDPFLHGVIRFKDKVKLSDARSIVGGSFMVAPARRSNSLDAYRSHDDAVKVERKKKSSWIKSNIRDGLNLLSRVSGSVASILND